MTTLFDDFQNIFAVYIDIETIQWLLSFIHFLLLVIKPNCNIERKLARYWQHTYYKDLRGLYYLEVVEVAVGGGRDV